MQLKFFINLASQGRILKKEGAEYNRDSYSLWVQVQIRKNEEVIIL